MDGTFAGFSELEGDDGVIVDTIAGVMMVGMGMEKDREEDKVAVPRVV